MKQWFIKHHRLLCRVLTFFAALGLILSIGFLILRWPTLPDTVPTHYDFAGNVDSMGGKSSLILLPVINVFCFALVTVCEFFPQTWNTGVKLTPQNSPYILALTRTMLVVTKCAATLGLDYICLIQTLQKPLGIGFMPVFLAAVLLPTVIYMILAVRGR